MSGTAFSDLEQFLTYLGKKGLLTPAVAASRKAAANKVFAVLDEDELSDVLSVDVERAVSRFANLHGREYTPSSVQAYASRLRSSLDDFRRYVDDPVNFKIGGSSTSKASKTPAKAPNKARGKVPTTSATQAEPVSIQTGPAVQESIFPIPIRENLTVKIYGLPFDLSDAEANKIAAVIKAMAQ